jgi:hypothetical protein
MVFTTVSFVPDVIKFFFAAVTAEKYCLQFAQHITWGRCYDHNFLRFAPIFGRKRAFFLKNNVMIQILEKLAVLCTINALFRPIVWRKYFKSHNIGPWVAKLGKINSLPVVATYQFPLIF